MVLWANYFELTGYENLLLYRHSISIAPDRNGREPGPKKRRRIVQILLEEYFSEHEADIVTDFHSNIISKTKLALQSPYAVAYRGDGVDDVQANATVYQVSVAQTGVSKLSELLDHVTSEDAVAALASKADFLQALNIVAGHHPKATSNVAAVGSNKHFNISTSSEKYSLSAGVSAIRGLFMSVRAATARILVNVQVKHGAFYQEGPLEGLIISFKQENGADKNKLEDFLKRLTVNVTHIRRKNRTGEVILRLKQISGLATPRDGEGQPKRPIVPEFGAGPKSVKFWQAGEGEGAGGSYVTVFEFFKKTYSIVIRDPNLPVVNVGNRQNPVYLPAQVCQVRPGQHFSGKLSPSQTQNMIGFAVRPPEPNARWITTHGAHLVGFDVVNPVLNNFGLKVAPKLIPVPGRVLQGPNVQYHGKVVAVPRFGSWNLKNVRFSATTELPYWTYLVLSVEGSRSAWTSEATLRPALQEFTQKLNEVGLSAGAPTTGQNVVLKPSSLETQIDQAISLFMHSKNQKPPKFLLVFLPHRDTAIYNRIKLACDITEGLLNVCTVASKFLKPNNHQYFANLALKVNLKLGGRNHIIDDSKLGVIAEGKTMLVGLDVTHPSPGSVQAAPSMASVVASVDRWLGQWPAELLNLPPRQEMITGLKEMIVNRLKLWQKNNGSLPDNILVYRDGVSESQYDQVLEQELPLFRAAGRALYPGDKTKNGYPRISIVVVGKRHNTRFYPTRKEDADRSSNPPNGTVVDRGVTEARNWDFFLQAHTALQGTARPAHYYVVLDEIFRGRKVKSPFHNTADSLEDLTHNLCYLFGRATKAVSICPPAYYADLACERARCYLSKVYDPRSVVSSLSSTHTTSAQPDASVLRQVHANVRDSMFYI
ncbi:hypothetical protein LTS15_002831 [Exophiala xenobiotica]|nr:hypothetical protein LTS15_002831 [Exophiala xenobiotica]